MYAKLSLYRITVRLCRSFTWLFFVTCLLSYNFHCNFCSGSSNLSDIQCRRKYYSCQLLEGWDIVYPIGKMIIFLNFVLKKQRWLQRYFQKNQEVFELSLLRKFSESMCIRNRIVLWRTSPCICRWANNQFVDFEP